MLKMLSIYLGSNTDIAVKMEARVSFHLAVRLTKPWQQTTTSVTQPAHTTLAVR